MSTTVSSEAVPIGVGIDTARYGHHATFLRQDLQPATAPLEFTETCAGYNRLLKKLQQLQRRFPAAHFHIRIDAASQYATNLETFLRKLPFSQTISVGEPRRNKSYCRAHFPKRKADVTDSYCQARYAIVERPKDTPGVPKEFYALREIASRLEAQIRQSTRLTNQLHNLLARVFPELACVVSDLAAAWVLHLLQKYPTPDKLCRAQDASLMAIPHLSLEKADPLRALAKSSIGTLTGEVAEELVRTLVGQLQQSRAAKDRLEKLLVQAYHALPVSSPITSIPGIGDATAAVLTAKIVDIDRFTSADQLVAYFGVFPEEHTSGVDKFGKPLPPGTMHMSRQGNDLVRKYLWNAAMSAVQYNPAARALYNRLLARGARPSVTIGHVMRKLLHLVFAIWKSGKPFDPNHYPWETPDTKQQVAGRNQGTRPARTAVTATQRSNVNKPARTVNRVRLTRTHTTQTNPEACHAMELPEPVTPAVPLLEENCSETARPAPSGRANSPKMKGANRRHQR